MIDRPIHRLGFACVLSDGSLTTNRTFRLASLGPERLAETALLNLDDLQRMLEIMREGPLRLLRLGGSIVPFASHPNRDFDWEPFVAPRLREIGEMYAPLGFRFSSHPGPYTILNSPDSKVVAAAIAEIDYAVRVLDLMGLDDSHRVIIHGGALYGDREAATQRLIEALCNLPDRHRARLVLENDERYFSLREIVEVAEASGIPVVFDLHHHTINPVDGLEELLVRVGEGWRCRPKVHMSSQKPNARAGAHDDLVHPPDLARLCEILPFETDVMVESKGKERAAMAAWRWLDDHGKLADG